MTGLSQWLPKVDGNEGQPDDTRGVHGETDVLGLVKSGRDLACEDGVNSAQGNQKNGISKGHHVRRVRVRRTNQQVVLSGRVMVHGVRWRHPQPPQQDHSCNFNSNSVDFKKKMYRLIGIGWNLLRVFISFQSTGKSF